MKSHARSVALAFASCVVSSAAAEMLIRFVDIGQGGGVSLRRTGRNIVQDSDGYFSGDHHESKRRSRRETDQRPTA